MLHLKFAEPLSGEASVRHQPIDPGTLMRLVSRNTKRGAQFTPQGILRWPLTSAKAEDVLAETRALLDALKPFSITHHHGSSISSHTSEWQFKIPALTSRASEPSGTISLHLRLHHRLLALRDLLVAHPLDALYSVRTNQQLELSHSAPPVPWPQRNLTHLL